MATDAPVLHGSDDGDLMLFDIAEAWNDSTIFDQPTLPTPKRRLEDLRVEGPLTPPMFFESPAKKLKSVTFSDMPQYIPELPSDYENGDDILSPEDDFAGFYRGAEAAKGRVEHESLSGADTTKRVDAPRVDFALPVAPWDEYKHNPRIPQAQETALDAQMKLLLQVKRNDLKSATTWHGNSKLDKVLNWDPFPFQSATVTIDEKLHGEENLSKVLAELTLGEIATSSTDLWKRDGLRLLEDEEDSEYELEPVELQEHKDMEALIRKRKLEMEEAVSDAALKRKDTQPAEWKPPQRLGSGRESLESHHWNGGAPRLRKGPKTRSKTSEPQHEKPSRSKTSGAPNELDRSLMFGGRFSASSALENFMAMHGVSAEPAKAAENRESAATRPPASSMTVPVRSAEQSYEALSRPSHASEEKLPKLPSLPKDLPPCSFIISLAFSQQRSLTKQLEKLYQDADLVVRDFDLPHSASREADLILSPSTGLIITTLQQIKQRALPGQPDTSPIKERISTLQYRYERLVVMVTDGLSREAEEYGSGRPVDPRDQAAISQFESFASRIGGEVLVRYVPGGEQALARSIVGEMARYGLPHGSRDIGDIKPLPGETTVGTLPLFSP